MRSKFNEKIKNERNLMGKSQKEIAKELMISDGTYAHWEQGRSEPNLQYIIMLAKFFNVTTDYLLGLEDDFGVKINEQKGREKKLEDMELLTQIYLKLNERLKAKLMGYALGLAEQQK